MKRLTEKKVIIQTEKRENLKSRIEEILFREENLTQKVTEQFIFPFEQSGYLSTEQKLELLLYATEQRRKKGEAICLLWELGKDKTIITEGNITELYLQWKREDRCFFSWEEKKEILISWITNRLGLGAVGILLRIGGDAIEIGAYVTGKNEEDKIGVRKGNKTFRFPFLKFSSEEEMERTIRSLVSREKHGEVTMQNPLWCHEGTDGTRFYAIRPPASPHWGMKIIFRNEGQCQYDGENRVCRV